MIVGLLLLGAIAGIAGAGAVLVAGGSFLLAVAAYSGIGTTAVFLAALLAAFRTPASDDTDLQVRAA